VNEELQPDPDIVLDFRFTEIEAELFVVLQHLEAVEHQLPQVVESERQRLEKQEVSGVEDYYEHNEIKSWIDSFADDVLPRLRLA
jgi:hypothetical protein